VTRFSPTKRELSTIEAAQQEAVLSVADMARDAIRRHSDGSGFTAIEVRDEDGPMLQVMFYWRHKRFGLAAANTDNAPSGCTKAGSKGPLSSE
jgi:hypothetical protein